MKDFKDTLVAILAAKVRDYLRQTEQSTNLRIRVKCIVYYELVTEREHDKPLFSSESEDDVKELFKEITGKNYTREIQRENRDFDS